MIEAAASFGGSTAFFTIALIFITILVLLLLRHYLPLRTTPAYLLLPVFLALALPCSIILLVPIDLASNAVEQDGAGRGIRLPDGAMLVIWRIAYWLTFVLTWAILPLLGEYADAGHRDPKARFIYSVRSNIRYQLIVLACGIAGLVYFVLSQGISGVNIKGLVVALAYTWGLTLAIYLMGHGLVALPRRVFRNASVVGRLRQLQASAPLINDRMIQAIADLEDLESEVWQLRRTKGHGRFQEWIDELADTSDVPESRAATAAAASRSQSTIPAVVTERYLAELTRKLKRARHKRIRFIEEWDNLVRAAADTQTILDAAGSRSLDFGKVAPTDSLLSRFNLLTPTLRYYLHAYIYVGMRYALSAVLAIFSVCLVWSEVLNPVFPAASIVRYTVVHHPKATETGKIGFAGQVIAGVWLCYMCTAALFSIRHVPIWGNRALVRRHTYAESATWYACQVAKLTVPLSFNFIMLLPQSIYAETTFYQFLGKLIDLTAIGSGFNRFFPIIILLPVAAASFNLYGKVKSTFGFGVIEDDSDGTESGFGGGGWREGMALLQQDRLDRNSASLGLSSRLGSGSSSPRVASPRRQAVPSSQLGRTLPTYHDRNSAPITSADSGQSSATRSLPAEDDEPSNPFAAFAHRVRNTFETATDRPDFSFNITRPKWMGGGMAGNETSGRAEFGGSLGRFFGGRPDDGRVRL